MSLTRGGENERRKIKALSVLWRESRRMDRPMFLCVESFLYGMWCEYTIKH